MPAIWSSSERPISVRTVWVDGIRHAILSRDDPYINSKPNHSRPQTTSSIWDKKYPLKIEQRKSKISDDFDGCFVKLSFVFEKCQPLRNDSFVANANLLSRRQSAPVCSKSVRKTLSMSINKKGFEIANYETKSEESNSSLSLRKKDHIESEEDIQHSKALSEKVLQWLDLSGRSEEFQIDGEIEKLSKKKQEFPSITETKSAVPVRYLVLHSSSKDPKDYELFRKIPGIEQKFDSSENENSNESSERSESNIETDAYSDEESSKIECKSLESILASSIGKPELHIFMPNWKSLEKCACKTSQESIVSESAFS